MHPELFMNTDRASSRLSAINDLGTIISQGHGLPHFLAYHGIAGDYLPQGMLYFLGGQSAVILGQIMLLVISLFALYKLAFMLTASARASCSAAIIYLHLPHSLFLTHVLAAEAIYDPLLVISFYLTLHGIQKNVKLYALIGGAALLGIATLIRPITALWPFVMLVLFITYGTSWRRAVLYLCFSMLPLVLWALFIGNMTGKYSLGASNHDLTHNLYKRVERIASTLPKQRAQSIRNEYLTFTDRSKGVLSVSTYIRFVSQYPDAYLAQLGREGVIFFGKSGLDTLILNYFPVDPHIISRLHDKKNGWKNQIERQGWVSGVAGLLSKYPGLIISSLVGSIVFIVFLAFSTFGAWDQLKRRAGSSPHQLQKIGYIALALFPIYLFVTSQVVGNMTSRHRAPSEFTLCILAVTGCLAWRASRLEKKKSTNITDAIDSEQ